MTYIVTNILNIFVVSLFNQFYYQTFPFYWDDLQIETGGFLLPEACLFDKPSQLGWFGVFSSSN